MEIKSTTTAKVNHTITIENRIKTTITAVAEVLSASQGGVYLKLVADGNLEISGENLKVEKLLPEEKLLVISGTVCNLKYVTAGSKNFLKKLFK